MASRVFLLVILWFFCGVSAQGAETGRSAALKYFTPRAKKQIRSRAPASTASEIAGRRLIGLSVGSLLNSETYNWTEESLPGWHLEAFYQQADSGYFAEAFHLEVQKFALEQEELTKVSFLFSLTFPRRLSFPVYLGVAAGAGYFLKQQENESHFSFDYKAYAGLRLNQAHSQYFVQSGVKNHVHVLSDGQFIGWFVSSGVAYTF